MTNQQPPQGWSTPQPPAGAGQHAPSAPASQYGSPQRPQGYAMPPNQPAPRWQESEGISVGRFTLRELIIFVTVFLLVISSFLPMMSGNIGTGSNLWNPVWPLAIPGVLLPLAAAVLILIRRLAPTPTLRVGSLSVDQFASVVAIVAAATYLGLTLIVLSIGAAVGSGFGLFSASLSFGPVLGIVFSLILVALTTFGPLIPPFATDFRGREAINAHVMARPVKPVVRAARPTPAPGYGQGAPHAAPGGYAQQPAPYTQDPHQHAVSNAASAPGAYGDPSVATSPYARPQGSEGGTAHVPASGPAAPLEHATPAAEPQHDIATPDFAAESAPSDADATGPRPDTASQGSAGSDAGKPDGSQPTTAPVSASGHVNGATSRTSSMFWVWSPRPRPVVDEQTRAHVFDIGPGAWALAVDDRGDSLLIRHDDGRVGVLEDVEGLMRG
ncbi:hypothetical protein [Paramicrobacterium agarici]|uniref:Uncharacterized protein n=1 Tax=Paramicrobacterium agarici TaxID=630514 RepID=A0A2A9DYP9_9MICO|nr:hypothetical protein [Microbacterium agarici]PFG31441.1 hypothetical protein ATJ78_2408 [Microbacterium agarici]